MSEHTRYTGEEAEWRLSSAAALGDVDAQYALAVKYTGKYDPKDLDLREAFIWADMAAKNKHPRAKALKAQLENPPMGDDPSFSALVPSG